MSFPPIFQEEDDDNSNTLSMVTTRLGRQLSPAELDFVKAQLESHTLMKVKPSLRSEEEKAKLKFLLKKINNKKTREFRDCWQLLIEKNPPKTNTQKWQERRERLSEEQVRRDREANRVVKVSSRAGGLTEERKEDVRAGQRKNRTTSVYSGDALRNKEIFGGTFFVKQLEEEQSDSLGTLGDTKCNHCHALR